jgi:hypothetical protein
VPSRKAHQHAQDVRVEVAQCVRLNAVGENPDQERSWQGLRRPLGEDVSPLNAKPIEIERLCPLDFGLQALDFVRAARARCNLLHRPITLLWRD